MIRDCIEIFEEKMGENGDKIVIDNYTPKDGTYILVSMKEDGFYKSDPIEINYDKKKKVVIGQENINFPLICHMDYYSKLIEMNKPIDPTKTIHSNNYLSFAVKKESIKSKKLTDDIIHEYYGILKNPKENKYIKKGAKSVGLYEETEEAVGDVDCKIVDEIEEWIKENIYELEISLEKKDYLKVFFLTDDVEKTKNLYQNEGMRYIIPNLFNSNDFNLEIDGKTYGLPNDNMGMNSKKPYLANKVRGNVEVPLLLDKETTLKQMMFCDYLMAMASKGKKNIYFDIVEKAIFPCAPDETPDIEMKGYFLRVKKGKEVEIEKFDTVTSFNPFFTPPFISKTYFESEEKVIKANVSKKKELEAIVDEVLFSKYLRGNYFTEPGDMSIDDGKLKINIIIARDRLFEWFYTKDKVDVKSLIDKVSDDVIINSIEKGYIGKAKKQLSLKLSFMDYFNEDNQMEVNMYKVEEELREHMKSVEPWTFSDDDEYYFAVGQLVSFFINKSKAAKKPLSFVNPFINSKKDELIKKQLNQLFKRFDYDIYPWNVGFKDMFSRVTLHKPIDPINKNMILAGLMSQSIIYSKKETKEEK